MGLLGDFILGVISDTADLKKGIKEVVVETKRDIISDLKKEAPVVGKTVEVVDRLTTTYNNGKKQLPVKPQSVILSKSESKRIFSELNRQSVTEYQVVRGQHLQVERFGYSHHAIALDEGSVIHYQDGEVKLSSMNDFSKDAKIYVIDTVKLYDDETIIKRAFSRYAEKKYNLAYNNCEHFVKWAMQGD